MKLIELMFSGFWTFIGFAILITMTYEFISNVVSNICRTIILRQRLRNKHGKISV